MSALLHCLQPPKIRPVKPTRVHICYDDVDVGQRKTVPVGRTIEWNGEHYRISELARLKGMDRRTLNSRLHKGWTLEDALSKPVAPRSPRVSRGR